MRKKMCTKASLKYLTRIVTGKDSFTSNFNEGPYQAQWSASEEEIEKSHNL